MNAQQYHDRVLAEARTLVAQGVKIDDAVAQANRTVQAVRGPQPTAVSRIMSTVLQQMTGGLPTTGGR
jgi:hypothetical protein